MPRSTYQLGLGFVGKLAVLLILGFLVLPVAVVTIAAFNDRAILSFPPQAWSLRWFAKAIAYQDFRDGFRNGLIVTAWSSTIALLVGAMFAFALDRYRFRFSKLIEAILLSPLVIPHFTVGLGFLILAAQIGWTSGYAVVVFCHVVLVLPFVIRSVYVSLRNLDQSYELAAASLGAPPLRVLLTVTLPLLLPGLVIAVRHGAADADPACRHVQLCAGICRSVDGGAVGDVHRRHGCVDHLRQCIPGSR